MKFTVTLSEAEVNGMKSYLKEIANIEHPTKADLQSEINNYVSGILHSQRESVADYVNLAELQANRKIKL